MQDNGSFDPGPQRPTQIAIATSAAEKALLSQRCQRAETRFRAAPLHDLEPLILDFRALHTQLFDGLCPSLPEAVGGYRGAAGTAIEDAQRVVLIREMVPGLRKTDPCLEPGRVRAEMAKLTSDMSSFWAQPGHKTTLAHLTHRFFWIHPFLDGNGHVWRLILIALARRAGCSVSADWQVGTRPYGPEFSLGLQLFTSRPELLELEMGKYFHATA